MEPVELTEPGRVTRATLVDLLDRLLEKGLVIRADIIVSLAGVPLIGVNLSAAIAGMETMLQYGMMVDWDERTRACAPSPPAAAPGLLRGEELISEMRGFVYHSEGIYRAWRPGTIYLTRHRLIVFQQAFGQLLLELRVEKIASLALTSVTNLDGKERDVLVVLAEGAAPVRLRGRDMRGLRRAIADRLAQLGREVDEGPALTAARARDPVLSVLAEGEEITHSGKLWYQVGGEPAGRPGVLDWFLDGSDGVDSTVWRRGVLSLTTSRLFWWDEFYERIGFEVPLVRVASCAAETRNLSKIQKRKRIIDIVYSANGSKQVVSFAGKAALEWQRALECVLREGVAGDAGVESPGGRPVMATASPA